MSKFKFFNTTNHWTFIVHNEVLTDNSVRPITLNCFSEVEPLANLNLHNLVLDDQDIASLIKLLSQDKFAVLYATALQIASSDTEALTNTIANSPPLITLELIQSKLTDDFIIQLATKLENNTTLKCLYLNANYNIKNKKCIQSIAAMIKYNTTLVSLHLDSNDIGDEGVTLIAESLISNPPLRYLTLKNNKITQKGANELSMALEYNSNLKILDLEDNNSIPKLTIEAIETKMSPLQRLEKLSVQYHQMR